MLVGRRIELCWLLGFVAGCGSRTRLQSDSDACYEPGVVEPCETDCGEGTRACEGGRWQPCNVPIVRRACSNGCGQGIASCIAGAWGTCEVPAASRGCSNDCGQGTESCTNGAWSACEAPVATRECSSLCGVGHETCVDGKWQNCDAPRPDELKLRAKVRDFHDTHPDFERLMGSYDDKGIVETTLGSDDKPVYAGHPTTPTTSGKYYFDTWYNDTAGINESTSIWIPLTPSPSAPATLVYDNGAFFPIDGQLFGNEGRPHNFHFTVEIAVKFRYAGGETFRFTGDDDMWVFINRRLAINLGGPHSAETDRVNLDARSQELGIAKGDAYPLHMFFAERHTSASTFHIETTVAEWDSCD